MRGYVEIATRRSGSLEVSLCWDRAAGTLLVVAQDSLTGDGVSVPVDAEDAAEVYRHPFAYATSTRSAPAA